MNTNVFQTPWRALLCSMAAAAMLMAGVGCGSPDPTATPAPTATATPVPPVSIATPVAGGNGGQLFGEWVLLSFVEGGSSVPVIAGTEITATFSADGEVSGNGGCNGYQGSYAAGEGSISFGAVAITEIGCSEPEGILEQETRFVVTFTQAETYRFADGNLALEVGSGRELVFAPAPG